MDMGSAFISTQNTNWSTFTNAMSNWQSNWTPPAMNVVGGSPPYVNFDAQAAAIMQQTQASLNALMQQTANQQAKQMQDTAAAITNVQANLAKLATDPVTIQNAVKVETAKVVANPISIVGDLGSKTITNLLNEITKGYDALASIEKSITPANKAINPASDIGMVLDNIQRRKVDIANLGASAIETAKAGTVGNIDTLKAAATPTTGIYYDDQKNMINLDKKTIVPAPGTPASAIKSFTGPNGEKLTLDLTVKYSAPEVKPVTQAAATPFSYTQPVTTPAGWQNVNYKNADDFLKTITPEKTTLPANTTPKVGSIIIYSSDPSISQSIKDALHTIYFDTQADALSFLEKNGLKDTGSSEAHYGTTLQRVTGIEGNNVYTELSMRMSGSAVHGQESIAVGLQGTPVKATNVEEQEVVAGKSTGAIAGSLQLQQQEAQKLTTTHNITEYSPEMQTQVKAVLGNVKQFTIADYNKAANNKIESDTSQKSIDARNSIIDTINALPAGATLLAASGTSVEVEPAKKAAYAQLTGPLGDAYNWVYNMYQTGNKAEQMGVDQGILQKVITTPGESGKQTTVQMGTSIVQPTGLESKFITTQELATKQSQDQMASMIGGLKALLSGGDISKGLQEKAGSTTTYQVANPQVFEDMAAKIITTGSLPSGIGGLSAENARILASKYMPDDLKDSIVVSGPGAEWVVKNSIIPNAALSLAENWGFDRTNKALTYYTPTAADIENAGWTNIKDTLTDFITPNVTGQIWFDIPLLIGSGGFVGIEGKALGVAKNAIETKGIAAAEGAVRALGELNAFRKEASIVIPAATKLDLAMVDGLATSDLTSSLIRGVGGDVLFVPKGGAASLLHTEPLTMAAVSMNPEISANAMMDIAANVDSEPVTIASILNEATKTAQIPIVDEITREVIQQQFTIVDANKIIQDWKTVSPQLDLPEMVETEFNALQGIKQIEVQAPKLGGLAEAMEIPITPETMDVRIQARLEQSIAGQTANAKNELATKISQPITDALEKFGIRTDQTSSVRQISLLGDKDFANIAKNVKGLTQEEAITQLKDIKTVASDLRSTIKIDTNIAMENIKSVLANADTTTLDAFSKKTLPEIKNMVADWQLTTEGRELTTAEKNMLSQQMYALKSDVADEIETRNLVGKWSEYAKQKSRQNELVFDEDALNAWMKENHPEIIAEDEKTEAIKALDNEMATQLEDYQSGLEAKAGTFRKPDAILSPDEFLQWKSYTEKAGTEILAATETADAFVKDMKATDYFKSLSTDEQQILEKDVRAIIQGRVLPAGEWKALETSLMRKAEPLTLQTGIPTKYTKVIEGEPKAATQIASQKLLDHSIVGGSDQAANYYAKKEFNRLANDDIKNGIVKALNDMEYKSQLEKDISANAFKQSGYGEIAPIGMTESEATNTGLYPWEYTNTEKQQASIWDIAATMGEKQTDLIKEPIQTTWNAEIAKEVEATKAPLWEPAIKPTEPVLTQIEELGKSSLLDSIKSGEIKNIAEVSPDELLSVPMKDINALRGTGPDSKLINGVMNERAKVSREVMASWGDTGASAAKKAETGAKFTKEEMNMMLRPENLQTSVDALWTSTKQRNIGEEALALIKDEYTAGKMGIDDALKERDKLLGLVDEIKKVACI